MLNVDSVSNVYTFFIILYFVCIGLGWNGNIPVYSLNLDIHIVHSMHTNCSSPLGPVLTGSTSTLSVVTLPLHRVWVLWQYWIDHNQEENWFLKFITIIVKLVKTKPGKNSIYTKEKHPKLVGLFESNTEIITASMYLSCCPIPWHWQWLPFSVIWTFEEYRLPD